MLFERRKRRRFKNIKIYLDCMDSTEHLPPKDFVICEMIHFEYFTSEL